MPFDACWKPNPDPQLRLLLAVRDRLSNENLWCKGKWQMGNQLCLVRTLRVMQRPTGVSFRVRRKAVRSLVACVPLCRITPRGRRLESFLRTIAPESYLIGFNDDRTTHEILCAVLASSIFHRQQELVNAV